MQHHIISVETIMTDTVFVRCRQLSDDACIDNKFVGVYDATLIIMDVERTRVLNIFDSLLKTQSFVLSSRVKTIAEIQL